VLEEVQRCVGPKVRNADTAPTLENGQQFRQNVGARQPWLKSESAGSGCF
jgi:hypothetical protein